MDVDEDLPDPPKAKNRKDRLYRLSSNDIIYSKSNELGEIIEFNDAFIYASGYTPDFLLGKNHNILKHPDVPDIVFKDIYETIGAGYPWYGAVKNRRSNGDYYWVYASIIARIEDGVVKESESVRFPIVDLSEIERLENAYAEIRSGEREYVSSREWIGMEDEIKDNISDKGKANLYYFSIYSGLAVIVASAIFYPVSPWIYSIPSIIVMLLTYSCSKNTWLGERSDTYDVVMDISRGYLRKKVPPLGIWTEPLARIRAYSANYLAFKKEASVKREYLRLLLARIHGLAIFTNQSLRVQENSSSCGVLVDGHEKASIGKMSKLLGSNMKIYLSDGLLETLTSSKSINSGTIVINDRSYDITVDTIEIDTVKKGYLILLYPSNVDPKTVPVRDTKAVATSKGEDIDDDYLDY